MPDMTQIDIAKLRTFSTLAHNVGEDLIAAHFEDKNRAFFIDAAADKLIDIGHVVGLTFSRTHPVRGELAIQRAERAIVHGTRATVENIAAKAMSADVWKRRAETAEAVQLEIDRANQQLVSDANGLRRTIERQAQQLADMEAEVLALRAGTRRVAA